MPLYRRPHVSSLVPGNRNGLGTITRAGPERCGGQGLLAELGSDLCILTQRRRGARQGLVSDA